jgi:hypothetical protein
VNGYVLEAVGWLGSALLVYSVLQTRFLRFRILNGIASGVLVAYNAVVGVWPMVGVNVVLVLIDAYFLVRLQRDQRRSKAFEFCPADGALRAWFDDRFGADIARFHPGYGLGLAPAAPGPDDGQRAVVLFHEERAIGLVVWRPAADGTAELLADYVIPAYRDFAPGGFVYSAAGPLRAAGLSRVWTARPAPAAAAYLAKLGFQPDETAEPAVGRLALTLAGRPSAPPRQPTGATPQ